MPSTQTEGGLTASAFVSHVLCVRRDTCTLQSIDALTADLPSFVSRSGGYVLFLRISMLYTRQYTLFDRGTSSLYHLPSETSLFIWHASTHVVGKQVVLLSGSKSPGTTTITTFSSRSSWLCLRPFSSGVSSVLPPPCSFSVFLSFLSLFGHCQWSTPSLSADRPDLTLLCGLPPPPQLFFFFSSSFLFA